MRLFIALQPSPEFWKALAKLQTRLRAIGVEGRYLDPSNLHLTLTFIGEWPTDITPLLPAVREPFSITLSHVGMFERAKVLWAGVEPSEPLNSLADFVRKNLSAADVPFDPQAFNPHITLIRKPVLTNEDVFTEIKAPRVSMTVTEVCLYKSEHLETGMQYTVIGRSKGAAG